MATDPIGASSCVTAAAPAATACLQTAAGVICAAGPAAPIVAAAVVAGGEIPLSACHHRQFTHVSGGWGHFPPIPPPPLMPALS